MPSLRVTIFTGRLDESIVRPIAALDALKHDIVATVRRRRDDALVSFRGLRVLTRVDRLRLLQFRVRLRVLNLLVLLHDFWLVACVLSQK